MSLKLGGRPAELPIVIPSYDESMNVTAVTEQLIATLRTAGIPYALVLVDNGSEDDTRQCIQAVVDAHPEARPVIVQRNVGYGADVLAGLRHATGYVLGFMWGAGQVDPASVVQTYRKLIGEGLAFCKGTGVVRHEGSQRRPHLWSRPLAWCALASYLLMGYVVPLSMLDRLLPPVSPVPYIHVFKLLSLPLLGACLLRGVLGAILRCLAEGGASPARHPSPA